MIFIKSFFRKSKIKIYLTIFVVLLTALMTIFAFNEYYNRLLDNMIFDHSEIIMISTENHDEELENESGITSYYKALDFQNGADNDIIYMPNGQINGTSATVEENEDSKNKISWQNLYFRDCILALPASLINMDIDDNSVILATNDYDYKSDIISSIIGKKIEFKYNDKSISLVVNDIIMPKKSPYIYISDNLYSKLATEMTSYHYVINTLNYFEYERLSDKWENLEKNNFYRLETSLYLKNQSDSDKSTHFREMVEFLNIISIISSIIFAIIVILIIKDLVNDENKYNLLLKQVGYNKLQNLMINLKSLLLFDLIIFILAFIFSFLILILLNNIFGFTFQIYDLKCNFIIIAIVLFFEVLFNIAYFSKN